MNFYNLFLAERRKFQNQQVLWKHGIVFDASYTFTSFSARVSEPASFRTSKCFGNFISHSSTSLSSQKSAVSEPASALETRFTKNCTTGALAISFIFSFQNQQVLWKHRLTLQKFNRMSFSFRTSKCFGNFSKVYSIIYAKSEESFRTSKCFGS